MTATTAAQQTPAMEMPKSWFSQKGYLQGVFWITLVALTSNLNDILMRIAGGRLPSMEITFFRYFFAVLTLLPLMIRHRSFAFQTQRPLLHIVRSVLLFAAIACWSKGLTMVPLAIVSTIALTIPLFVLPMAAIFLKETVGWQRALATLVGFTGIFVVVLSDQSSGASLMTQLFSAEHGSIYLLCAAVCFALSDILNKKYVSKEPHLSMLFYIALGTACIGFYPAWNVWVAPTMQEILYLVCLGAGGNMILYFILKAFSAADVSALAPYRYTELFFALIFGYAFFHEIPNSLSFVGTGIIVLSTASIAYYEISSARKKR